MSAPNRFRPRLGKTEVLHLAGLNQILYRTSRFLNGSVGIDAMLVEKVDGIGLQALERPFDDLLDMLGAAVGRRPLAIVARIRLEPELCSDDHIFAERRKSFAHDFFIDKGAVHFGSVEEGYAPLGSRSDEFNCFRFLRRGTKTEA